MQGDDLHTGPSSDRLSKAHTPVVPNVAHSCEKKIDESNKGNLDMTL